MSFHADVIEKVLIPWMEITRNATISLHTSAILDEQILDHNTPVLKPTQKCIAKSVYNIKDCWNWLLDYIQPKPKMVDEALESFKKLITKNCTTRETLPFN